MEPSVFYGFSPYLYISTIQYVDLIALSSLIKDLGILRESATFRLRVRFLRFFILAPIIPPRPNTIRLFRALSQGYIRPDRHCNHPLDTDSYIRGGVDGIFYNIVCALCPPITAYTRMAGIRPLPIVWIVLYFFRQPP